jgi:hypothetical protein
MRLRRYQPPRRSAEQGLKEGLVGIRRWPFRGREGCGNRAHLLSGIGYAPHFGGVGVGDPAADVIAAWSVFGRAGRGVFRTALEVDDGTWERARGFALHQAALVVPYYVETNPGFVASARRTIVEVLADLDA